MSSSRYQNPFYRISLKITLIFLKFSQTTKVNKICSCPTTMKKANEWSTKRNENIKQFVTAVDDTGVFAYLRSFPTHRRLEELLCILVQFKAKFCVLVWRNVMEHQRCTSMCWKISITKRCVYFWAIQEQEELLNATLQCGNID